MQFAAAGGRSADRVKGSGIYLPAGRILSLSAASSAMRCKPISSPLSDSCFNFRLIEPAPCPSPAYATLYWPAASHRRFDLRLPAQIAARIPTLLEILDIGEATCTWCISWGAYQNI